MQESVNQKGNPVIYLDFQSAFDNSPHVLMRTYKETKLTWDKREDIHVDKELI